MSTLALRISALWWPFGALRSVYWYLALNCKPEFISKMEKLNLNPTFPSPDIRVNENRECVQRRIPSMSRLYEQNPHQKVGALFYFQFNRLMLFQSKRYMYTHYSKHPALQCKPSLSHKTILPPPLSPPATNEPLNPPPPRRDPSINDPPKKVRTPKNNNPINNRTSHQTLPPLSRLALLRNDLLD